MSKFIIEGPAKLHGTIPISGAKNAALKILPAAILGNSISEILNVPDIGDVNKMISILESIGAKISFNNEKVVIDPTGIKSYQPDARLVNKLRGSIVVAGPLLAKFGKAILSQPGGCLIGARPIGEHLDVFSQMGVKIKKIKNQYILSGRPKAGEIILSAMSVTATENAIMACVFSSGVTNIHVAAAEPEIADLALFLNKMGAKIEGAGTHDIKITGVNNLSGANHQIIPDRLEIGTYMIAAIGTNSCVEIGPIISNHLSLVFKKLKLAGAKFKIIIKNGNEFVQIEKRGELKAEKIDTRPYPGFPTDLQSPYAVLMTQARGISQIFETMFEGRFLYLDEIRLMGAEVEASSPQIIYVTGPVKLKGAEIVSRDIRGGAALVIAGLIADGKTTINGLELIDRGYVSIDKKLHDAGAKIKRVE